jgi:hypothetical protein
MPFELEERFLIAAERTLGASLPYSYRQATMTSNGGRVLAYDDVWDLYLHPPLIPNEVRGQF